MGIGPLEIGIVLLIVLVIFGPKRLPELGRSVGKGIREFRSSVSGDDDDDEDDSPSKPAQIEGAEKPDETVEGEVVTHQRS